jgi:HAD superfamily hydrolase (TIGR01509 family)
VLKALIWDVDGTLAETERDGHRVAFNEAFAAEGLPFEWDERRYGELLRVTGGFERLMADFATRADVPVEAALRQALARRLHAHKNRIYAGIVESGALQARPGVQRLISETAAAGIPQAVATTTSRANVHALLHALRGPDWRCEFAVVMAGEDTDRKKPDPQVYHRALQTLGLRAGDTIAIEDSAMGVAAAGAAGMAVVMTRSRYFEGDGSGVAVWAGPDLDSGPRGAIDLAQLRQWLSFRSAADHQVIGSPGATKPGR